MFTCEINSNDPRLIIKRLKTIISDIKEGADGGGWDGDGPEGENNTKHVNFEWEIETEGRLW